MACVVLAQDKVGEIALIGNEEIPDWKIRGLMRTKSASWFQRILGKAPDFKRRQLKNDLKIIADYYLSEGFLDSDITATANINKNDKRLYINVLIEEGPRYTLDSLIIEGDFPEDYPREFVRKSITQIIGNYINPSSLKKNARLVQKSLQDKGYPYATVISDYQRTASGSAFATISVEPGKKAFFGKVSYVGLTLTRQYVVQRELAFKAGEPYSAKKLTESKENLYRIGLFSLVSIEASNISTKPETLDYNITVAERLPRFIISRVGAGSDENYPITAEGAFGWGNRNFLGRGLNYSVEFSSKWQIINEWANLRNRFDIKYRQPWTIKTKTPLTLDLYFEPGNAEEIDQYSIQIIGFRIGAEHSTNLDFIHTLYFNYERADIYDVIDMDIQEQIFAENDRLYSRRLGYSVIRDRRDNILVPTYGTYLALQAEIGGYFLGGDEHYTKTGLGLRRYFGIRNKYVLAMRGKLGVIGNWRAGEDVLPHQRYYLGGASSVRGWQERSIGPKDSQGNPRGGKLLLLGNLELRSPLFWQLWGHAFFDTGNLWDYAEEFDPKDMKGSAGLGIALITPVGPIRFDYGFQIINKETPDSTGDVKNSNWHLSLMYAF